MRKHGSAGHVQDFDGQEIQGSKILNFLLIFKEKKLKVEKWESFLKTMRQSEKARFDGSETDCTQYAHVSRMLRDISKGRQPHGCMGALASASGGHGHRKMGFNL